MPVEKNDLIMFFFNYDHDLKCTKKMSTMSSNELTLEENNTRFCPSI